MMGTYTDIVEIVAPDEAVAGTTVSVQVRIKNLHSASIHIYAVAVLDSRDRFIDWLDSWVGPGQTKSFYGSFTMKSPGSVVSRCDNIECSPTSIVGLWQLIHVDNMNLSHHWMT